VCVRHNNGRIYKVSIKSRKESKMLVYVSVICFFYFFFSNTVLPLLFLFFACLHNLSCPVINVLNLNYLSPEIPCEHVSARCDGSANHAAFCTKCVKMIYTRRVEPREKKRIKIFSVRIYYDRVWTSELDHLIFCAQGREISNLNLKENRKQIVKETC